MPAGTTIKIKRKAGAFVGGELAAGELGLDTTNDVLYGSTDGTTVFLVGDSRSVIADGSGARTLSAADERAYIRLTAAGGTAVTIPPNGTTPLPVGFEAHFRRTSAAGEITLSHAGVTVNGSADVSTIGQDKNFTLKKVATDEWDFV